MKTALILIDLQNDYFPNGKMELKGSIEASLFSKKILDHFREEGHPVVHVQHISAAPGATFFIPNTDGAEIHENVKPLPNETIFQKQYPNAFRDTQLLDHLRNNNVTRLVFCGMMTHMCVDATVRAAFDHGFQCVVLTDACATRSLSFQGVKIPAEHVHGAFIAALSSVYAKAFTVDDFLTQMN